MKKIMWVLVMVVSMSFGVQVFEWGYEGEYVLEYWGKVVFFCVEGKN